MSDINVSKLNLSKLNSSSKSVKSQDRTPLALILQGKRIRAMRESKLNSWAIKHFLLLIIIMPSLGGCFFSPDLTAEENLITAPYPPVIFSAADPFEFPGPLLINRDESRTLSVTVMDNDIEDTIFMRLYVDYLLDNPLPALSECSAPSSEFEARIITTCSMSAVCNPIPVGGDDEIHILEVLVSDSPFIPDSSPLAEGQPGFRAIEDPVNSIPVIRSWPFRCVENN